MRPLPILIAVLAFVLGGLLVALLTDDRLAPGEQASIPATSITETVRRSSPQEADSGLRIAILDFSRIHQQSMAIQVIDTAYRAAIRAYAEDAKERETDLRAAEEALRLQEAEMAPEDYRQERALLQSRMARAMELVQERKRTLDLARQDGLNKVQVALNDIVTEMATEMQLSLILRKEQTVLVAVDYEITDEVLQRLNDRLPSVEVFAPEN